VDRRGLPEWPYKERAILQVAGAFRSALQDAALDLWTFVPVPPSKAKNDPLYDDRLTRMLREIRPLPPIDVRELILQTQSAEASHLTEIRPSADQIKSRYTIDERVCLPQIAQIAIVDDVLTAGAHFRAAKSILAQRFPTIRTIGLFIARRVPNTVEIEDLPF